MFGSSILEVAIGMIFVYLALSLICTAVNEGIATTINKRGTTLFGAVRNLLNDPNFTGLAQQVYNHGLVDGVSQDAADPSKETRPPSYLAPKTFSLALLDVLGANGVVSAAHGTALTVAEQADDAYEAAKQAAAAKPGDAGLKAEVEDKGRRAERARDALMAAAMVAEAALVEAAKSVTDQADSAADAPLTLAKAAYEKTKADRDSYEAAIKGAADPPTDEQRQKLEDARANFERTRMDFERARDAFFDAVQVAAKKQAEAEKQQTEAEGQGDEKSQPITDAKKTFDAANAAVKILDARRAAVASARDSKDLELRTQAANTLEQALVIGRKLFTDVGDKLNHIQVAVNRLPEGHTKESLLVLIDKTRRDIAAGGDAIVKFRENVEEWFNHAMDRVTGWYKRWTQRVQLILAIIVVLLLNADTIMLIKRFATDKEVRAAIVEQAKKKADQENQNKQNEQAGSELRTLEDAGLPIGWDNKDPVRGFPWSQVDWRNHSWYGGLWSLLGYFLLKLLGLAISVGAISMGAPFWFDTLNKFINLRGAGTPPGEPQKSAPTT